MLVSHSKNLGQDRIRANSLAVVRYNNAVETGLAELRQPTDENLLFLLIHVANGFEVQAHHLLPGP